MDGDGHQFHFLYVTWDFPLHPSSLLPTVPESKASNEHRLQNESGRSPPQLLPVFVDRPRDPQSLLVSGPGSRPSTRRLSPIAVGLTSEVAPQGLVGPPNAT